MKAVLMAGGSGTRLRPLTCDIPKPMVPMLTKPMAEHIINLLKRHGVTDIVITLYYLPHVIQNYFGDGHDFGVKISYAVEEKMPLGTAGCVKAIEDLLDDTFLVISGDSLTDIDLAQAVAFHKAKQSLATIVLKRVNNPLEFGVVITDEEGRIQRFLEKPSMSEVFSDTINTGTYILEPQVLALLPPDQEVDFSKDLFPLLLQRQDPMYGYVADGYWEDVGNLQSYRQAHYDILDGKVAIDHGYTRIEGNIWVGEGTVIAPSAQISGPVVIGHNCQIGAGATLTPGTVLGDNVIVGEGSSLKRPIIWNNVYIGEEVQLRGCVIGKGSSIKRGAVILEGAIVANDCVVGEEAQIKPEVKIWPNKTIDAGATLTSSLIWGSQAQRTLFGATGVEGLANIEITPEFAVKLGASYGATLPLGSSVTVSRDSTPASRMINRGMISGLLSVGVNVHNLESTSLPITRFFLPETNARGGIHIRMSADSENEVVIDFLDSKGMTISKAEEKKIESNFFKEDFRRVSLADIGNISFPARVTEHYASGYCRAISPEGLKRMRPKIVIDYANSFSNVMLPGLLGRMGAETVVLNAHAASQPPSPRQREELRQQLSHIVLALKATFGFQIDDNAERLHLVDPRGRIISSGRLLVLMVRLVGTLHPHGKVVVPVSAPSIIESVAAESGTTVIRTKVNSRAMMEASRHEGVIMAGNLDGKFIFPAIHPGYDAMMAAGRIAEALAASGRSVADLVDDLPDFHHVHEVVPCPWEQKGTVMRVLVEQSKHGQTELIDGVKVFCQGGWALVLPDPVDPVVHLFADANSAMQADQIIEDYTALIRRLTVPEDVPAAT
ncbi:MAG: mannose-1-phosphate guanyltransferase [Candidatus Sericytochromatia bacterium]|nr:mannose-1-phosphate guanyltransferase [Candidatus Sericytochromatia bacterium]